MTSSLGGSLLLFLGAPLLTLGAYVLTRHLMRRAMSEDTADVAASIAFRIAALHGLMISLVFAGEIQNYQQLRFLTRSEATALSEMYADLRHWDDEFGASVRLMIIEYAKVVETEEWPLLASSGVLSKRAWQVLNDIHDKIVAVTPETAAQVEAKSVLLDKARLISKTRHERWHRWSLSLPLVFWIAAIGGLIFVSASFFAYRPSAANLVLMGLYGLYTGVVLSIIHTLSQPYAPPASLPPLAFERIIAQHFEPE